MKPITSNAFSPENCEMQGGAMGRNTKQARKRERTEEERFQTQLIAVQECKSLH